MGVLLNYIVAKLLYCITSRSNLYPVSPVSLVLVQLIFLQSCLPIASNCLASPVSKPRCCTSNADQTRARSLLGCKRLGMARLLLILSDRLIGLQAPKQSFEAFLVKPCEVGLLTSSLYIEGILEICNGKTASAARTKGCRHGDIGNSVVGS